MTTMLSRCDASWCRGERRPAADQGVGTVDRVHRVAGVLDDVEGSLGGRSYLIGTSK